MTSGVDAEHVGNVRTRLEFGRELTRIRERAGLTVRDVARAVNIPVSTVGGYFSGTHLPPVKPPDMLVRILRACGLDDPEVLEQWVRALTRARRAPGPRRAGETIPYRGLARFEPEHAEWFHGRERIVADLVERAIANAEGGLLTVVGPSGSGKSSLLRAGLVAALSDSRTNLGWRPLILTPGPRPMASLAEQLAALTGDDTQKIATRLSGELYLSPELAQASDADQTRSGLADERIAIVVDQFEEVFIAGADEAERRAFVAALAAAAGLSTAGDGATVRPGPAALVVIGMRADFYASALRYPQLAEALQSSQVVVAPMGEAELRRAIVEPARRAKLTVDDGLVELLLRDLRPPSGGPPEVAHDAGALPLLSHALLATWERGGGASLTTADYRDTGGIRGAVARTAEEAYGSLTPLQQQLARRLFLRLVHVADDAADTRRYVPHTKICQAGDGVQDVLDVFVGHRLITAQADRITITHEAMLTAWPRLRSWIDADRAGLRIHRQLTGAAETWRGLRRDQSALYRGGRLSIATEWAAEPGRRAELDPIERDFLDASVAHALAEEQAARRRGRRMQQLIAALTALLVASAGSTAFALQQRAAADEQRNLAVARQIATAANQVRAKDAALAMQLSLVAYRIAAIPESRSSLLNSYGSPTVTRVLGPPGVMQAVAFSPDGRLMAAAGSDGAIRLWALPHSDRPVPVGEPLLGHTDTVYSLAFSPDGRMLASAGGDQTIRLWDTSDQRTPSAAGFVTGPANTVYSVAFSPDGRTLAAGSADSTVRLFDVTLPGASRPLGPALEGFTGFVQSVAFSPDGRFLAAGSADTTVRIWDVGRPVAPVAVGTPLNGPAKTVYSVAFHPDGRTLAAGSADGNVYLWDLVRADRPVSLGKLTGPGTWVNSVAFSPDGQRVAAASSDSNLWIWEAATREVTHVQRHPAPLTAVVFPSADPARVATAAADGVARIWGMPGPVVTAPQASVYTASFAAGHALAVTDTDNGGTLWNVSDPRQPTPIGAALPRLNLSGNTSGAAALSPDARMLISGDRDGTAQLWDLTDPGRPVALPTRLTGHTATIQSIAFSQDGQRIALGSSDTTVSLWDVADPRRPRRLRPNLAGPGNYVLAVAISRDGRLLAAGGADNTVRLWDITDPTSPRVIGPVLSGPVSYVYGLAFSPDNRLLAVGSADNSVRLFDLTDPAGPAPVGRALTGPDNYVYSVAFSSDGLRLAAGAGDGTAWLWDITNPRRPDLFATVTAHDKSIYVVAFDSEDPVLVTGGADRTARLWNVDPEQVAAYICATSGDDISRGEWDKYLPNLPYAPPCGR